MFLALSKKLKRAKALLSFQDVDKVNRLPDAEKPCKARKRGLQMRAHTWTYVTDFAARVDEASRNSNFVRSVQEISAVAGFGSELKAQESRSPLEL